MSTTSMRQSMTRILALGLVMVTATLGCGAGPADSPPDHGDQGEDHAGHAEGEGHEGETAAPDDDLAQDGGEDHGDEHDHDAEAGEAEAHGEHDEHGGEGEHADEVRLTPEAIREYGLRIESVRGGGMSGATVVPGRVGFNAEAVAHVGSPVQGRVSEIGARQGAQVKKGDVLLVIDSPELGEAQSDFLERSMGVGVARAGLEVARTTYERSKKLLEGKGLSLGEFQRREGEFRVAEGELLAAQAAATAAENRLHLYGMTEGQVERLRDGGEIDPRFQVRAPIDGRVVEREATLGEIVGPEREALMVLADMSTLWILADVPEQHIAAIRPGATARVNIGVLGQEISGAVTHIGAEIEGDTRTGTVRVEVIDPPAGLQPGMFAQVEIEPVHGEGATEGAVPLVPEAAVQTVEGGPAVFVPVQGEENTFAKRAVTLGERIGSQFPVLSGLAIGDAIVTEGSFILKAELGKAGAAHEH